jgi:hypothetical protein
MSVVCPHIDSVKLRELPHAIAGCEDCLAIGGTCVTYTYASPAVTSPAATARRTRHASAHARSAGHPIARSAEPGEDWSSCHLDDIAFVLTGR